MVSAKRPDPDDAGGPVAEPEGNGAGTGAPEAAGSDDATGRAAPGGAAEDEPSVAGDDGADRSRAEGEAEGDLAEPDPRPRGRLVGRLRSARSPQTRRRRMGAGAALVLVGLGVGAAIWWAPGAVPEGVAYRVDDQEVTVEQLEQEAATLGALYGLRPPTAEADLDRFHRDMAKASAVGLLMDRAAAEQGVSVSDKETRDVLAHFIDEFFGLGPDARERFVQAMRAAGTSEPAVLREISRQLAVRRLFDDVNRDVSIRNEEVRRTFSDREAELATPERREIDNIVVSTREEADRLVAELATGADFPALAAQRSLDEVSKTEGGKVGILAAAELESGYAQAAFATPSGGTFGPVETRFGWNVGRVVTIHARQPAVFEQVGEQLRGQLWLEQATARWSDWLSARLEEADVVYAAAYRPPNPDTVPTDALRNPARDVPLGGTPSPPN